MNLAIHAKIRARQRGFSSTTLNIIWKYGREFYAPGGAIKYFMGKKEHRCALAENQINRKAVDRAKNGSIIVIEGSIITAYKS
jgi:hypothetical protein